MANSGKMVASKRLHITEWNDVFPNVDEGLSAEDSRALLRALRVATGFFESCCELYEVVDCVSDMDASEFKSTFGIEVNDGDDYFEVLKGELRAPVRKAGAKKQKTAEGASEETEEATAD